MRRGKDKTVIAKALEIELVSKAKAGNGDAIATLIRAHQGGLYSYILQQSGHVEMAEDIVQEAFVRVLKNLDRFDPRFRFSTWLYTIARRLFVNANQKMKPAYDTDMLCDRQSGEPSPSQETARIEEMNNVREVLDFALDGLGSVQREIVELFYEKSWPVPRISSYLNIPEGTVKSHLYRARKRMKKTIESDHLLSHRVGELFA